MISANPPRGCSRKRFFDSFPSLNSGPPNYAYWPCYPCKWEAIAAFWPLRSVRFTYLLELLERNRPLKVTEPKKLAEFVPA